MQKITRNPRKTRQLAAAVAFVVAAASRDKPAQPSPYPPEDEKLAAPDAA